MSSSSPKNSIAEDRATGWSLVVASRIIGRNPIRLGSSFKMVVAAKTRKYPFGLSSHGSICGIAAIASGPNSPRARITDVTMSRSSSASSRSVWGQHHSADFDPTPSFSQDAAADGPHRAVLNCDESKVEGAGVFDLSWEGNSGVGVRWFNAKKKKPRGATRLSFLPELLFRAPKLPESLPEVGST